MLAQGHVHVVMLLVSCVQWGEGFITAVAPNQRVAPISRWEIACLKKGFHCWPDYRPLCCLDS